VIGRRRTPLIETGCTRERNASENELQILLDNVLEGSTIKGRALKLLKKREKNPPPKTKKAPQKKKTKRNTKNKNANTKGELETTLGK